MEIFYCSSCKSRVSSVEIEQGKGLKVENKPYCQDCVKKLDLKPAPAAPRPGSAKRVRKASDVKRPASSPVRRPGSERRVATPPPHVPAAPASNMTAIIAVLAVVVLGLIGLLVFLLARKTPPPTPPEVPKPPVVTETPPDKPRPDEPQPEKPEAPDKPQPPVQPDKPPIVAPGKRIPTAPDDPFPQDWKDLGGANWHQVWDPGRTAWEFKGKLLTALLDPEKGAGMLKSFPEWGNFEIGVQFATDIPCMIDFKFRDEGNKYGRYTISKAPARVWNTLTWRVKGSTIEKAEFNGEDVTRAFKTGKMQLQGRLSLAIRPARFEACRVSFGAIRLKELPYEVSSDARELVQNGSFRLGDGSSFKDWRFWGKWDNGVYTLHRGAGREDDACAEMRPQTQGRGGMYQKLEARTGEKILVTFWYRTEKADSGRIFMNLESPGEEGWKGKDLVGGTHGWQKAVLEATIPFDEDGRPMPYFSIYIYNASSGSVFVDDVSVRVVGGMAMAETPAPGPAAGKLDLLQGGSLTGAGWTHDLNPSNSGEEFKLEGGVLQKSTLGKRSRVKKNVNLSDGELSFEFDYTGSFLKLTVRKKDPLNKLGVQFTRLANGRHTCRIIVKGTAVSVFLDGTPATKEIGILMKEALTRPLGNGMSMEIDAHADASLRLWNLQFTPADVNDGGWTNLFPGADLAASGWKHYQNPAAYGEHFRLENGVLVKPRSEKSARVTKTMDLQDGEFSFECDFNGNYMKFGLYKHEPRNSLSVEFNRNAIGRHKVRILIKGTETTVFLDGKPAIKEQGVYIGYGLSHPLGQNMQVLIDGLDSASVRVWDLKYRPLGQGTMGDWTDLLPTDNLAASGWAYSHDNDSYGENFSIEGGTLIKPVRTKHCKVDRSVNFNRGELAFDYDMDGDYAQFALMGGGSIGLVFSVNARGKHSIRILATKTGATVFWDGKPLPEGDGKIRVNIKLQKPLRKPCTLRFYVSEKTGIRVSNLRYRQAE